MKVLIAAALIAAPVVAVAQTTDLDRQAMDMFYKDKAAYLDCLKTNSIRLGGTSHDDALTVVKAADGSCVNQHVMADMASQTMALAVTHNNNTASPAASVREDVMNKAAAALMEYRAAHRAPRRK